VLGVQKRMWLHGSRSWHAGSTRGGDVGDAGATSAGSGKAAARQGRARGLVQSGAGMAGVLYMAGREAAARG
jgi:hypothetical protein